MKIAALLSMFWRRSVPVPLMVAALVGAALWWLLPPSPRAVLPGLDGYPSRCIRLTFALDGRAVATWHLPEHDQDGPRLLRLWDVADGQPQATLYRGGRQLESLAFAPDGRHIAGRWFDRGVTVWDRADGRSIAEYRHAAWEQCNPHTQLIYSADNRLLVHGPDPSSGKLWDVATTEPACTLFRDNDAGFTTWFSGYEGFIVRAGNGRVEAWHLATAKLRGTFSIGEFPLGWFGLTPDGQTFASYVGGPDGSRLHLWHAHTGTHEVVPFADNSTTPALAPDASAVVVTLTQPVAEMNPVIEWLIRLSGNRFDPRGHYPRVRVIDIANSRVLADFGRAERATFAPDGRTLAVIGEDGTIYLYDWPFDLAWLPVLGGAALAAAATAALRALIMARRRRRSSCQTAGR